MEYKSDINDSNELVRVISQGYTILQNVNLGGANSSKTKCNFRKLFGKEYIVTGEFIARNCGLKELEGMPTEVHGLMDLSGNELTSLIGLPKKIINLKLSNNKLTNIDFFPEFLEPSIIQPIASLDLVRNKLTSLKGLPEKIPGNLNIANNPIRSLERGPKEIDGILNCTQTNILSLEGCPIVKNVAYFNDNPKLSSLHGIPENCTIKTLHLKNIKPIKEKGKGFYSLGGKLFFSTNLQKKYIEILSLVDGETSGYSNIKIENYVKAFKGFMKTASLVKNIDDSDSIIIGEKKFKKKFLPKLGK